MIFSTLSAGNVLAMIISWNRNSSILWAILHGIFGWFYVGYYFLFKKKRRVYLP